MWTTFIGFMSCGKTTVARRLEASTNRPRVSLDQLISDHAGLPIGELFSRRGEAAFREMELAALQEIQHREDLILDPGGGIVETAACIRLLRRRGVVIWLDCAWETARGRLLQAEDGHRPLLQRLGGAGLETLFRRRRLLYAKAAHFRLYSDRESADDLARKAMLRSLLGEGEGF